MKIAYTAHAKATGGGRNNGPTGTENGHLTFTIATPVEMGGSGKGTNPEELFASGYATCYLGLRWVTVTVQLILTCHFPQQGGRVTERRGLLNISCD